MGELAKLKAELDESNIAHEGTLAALRQKHNNNMSQMGDDIDGLNKMKANAEKDKAGMERDLQEARGSLDEAMRDRANQITELEMRLGEANEIASKGGRTAMAKLESRIRELEIELGSTQAKTGETYKTFQKAERHVKELQFQQDEDKKNQDRMSELAVKLQQKIKTYKAQIGEAEEIAALNLAKFRKAQQDLEENEDRAKMAGAALQVTM